MAPGRRDLRHLVERLAAIGVDDNARNLRNKAIRGKFTAGLLLLCLVEIEVKSIQL
jgi:hypothetical protein